MLIGIVHEKFTAVGGAEVLVLRQAEYLRARGHAVRFATQALDPGRWPRLAEEWEMHVVPKRWHDHLGVPGSYPKLANRVARLARRLRGVDLVLGSGYPGNLVAARLRARHGLPTAWYCNEPYRQLHVAGAMPRLAARIAATPPDADTPLLADVRTLLARYAETLARDGMIARYRAMDIAAVAQMDVVIGDSHFTRGVMRSVYGRDDIHVVEPTLALQDAPPRPRGMDPAGLHLLVHGRMELYKNVDTVLAGFARFRARHPGAHELHVVGTGPDAARLQALAATLGIADVARFHGFLDAGTLAEVYARCEVMALLPPDEPFGMVFMEAAQQGLLVVGPDHGGPFEILEEGAIGWTVDVFDPEPLAEALHEAWRLPEAEVHRRRARARESVRARYGPGATLARLEALLMGAARARGR